MKLLLSKLFGRSQNNNVEDTDRRNLLSMGGMGALGLMSGVLAENANAATWQPVSASGSFARQVQVFNASGTWVCPAGVVKVWVTAIGGGGGGGTQSGSNGTTNTVCGGGGGSGDMCFLKELTVVPGTSYTVTIGSGGAAEASGTATSFGALLTLAGGGGTASGTAGVGGGSKGSSGAPGCFGVNSSTIGGSGIFGGARATAASVANTGAGGGGGPTGRAGGSGCLVVEWVT